MNIEEVKLGNYVKLNGYDGIAYVTAYSPDDHVFTMCLGVGSQIPERYASHGYLLNDYPRFPVTVDDITEVMRLGGPPIEVFARYANPQSVARLSEEYRGVEDFATSKGYAIQTVPASRMGKRLSSVCRERGIEIRRVEHPVHRFVNGYPLSLLEEFEAEIRQAAERFRPLGKVT